MSHKLKRIFAMVLSFLLIAALLPTAALAAGRIDLDRTVEFELSYVDKDMPISNARFSIYKVADIDETGRMMVNSVFDPYKSTVSGLNSLNNQTKESWLTLASTLKGYVLRDGVKATASGMTDSEGSLVFPELPVGLYLVIGSRVTTPNFYTYSAVPFMAFLPGLDSAANEWDYSVTAVPKYSVDVNPPEGDDEFISRKVLKVWDDSGYESLRPTEITVQLLCDGQVYDTRTLSKTNNWRYAWDNLERNHDWEIVENEVEGYAVSVSRSGITFTVNNKFVRPVVGTNVPVQKRITGDTPKTASAFTFVFTAADASYPMPEGSTGAVKNITVYGAGSAYIGRITFTKPGTYTYSVYEQNTGVEGYTYDKTIFLITYHVTQTNGDLAVDVTITDSNGNAVESVEFTNPYKTPREKLPQTGALWWPVPVLLFLGLTFVVVGLTVRRKRNY